MRPPFLYLLPLLISTAHGEIIGVENFDYPDGPIATRNGGTFWDYKNTSPAGHTGTASAWANQLGTSVVTGGRLTTADTQAIRRYNGANETDGAISDANVAKTVYYRVNVTTGASLPGYMVVSSYELGDERIYFGKPFGSSTFGIGTGSGADTNTGPTVLPNTTYTLVAKLDLTANLVSLFVNPDLTAPEPSPTVSRPYTDADASTAIRLGSGIGGDPAAWDHLVVATAWSDFTTIVTTLADEDNGSLGGGAGISLREAAKYSAPGTLVTFAPGLSGSTITLTNGQMTILSALTIDATALPGGLTLGANNDARHFLVETGKSLTLRGLTLTRGNVIGDAGSIYNSGTLNLEGCTIFGNTAANLGGAVLNLGQFTAHNSTFSGNTAAFAGAVGNMLGATLTLRQCTVSENTATGSAGGVLTRGTMTLEKTIIADNRSPFDPDIAYEEGAIITTGPNLIGNNESVGFHFPAGPLVGTPGAPLDPKLSPLGHFGGPVLTQHPLIGSPAIDTGSTTDPGGTDARGFPRLVDGDQSGTAQIDLGAIEAGPLLRVDSASDSGSIQALRHNLLVAAATPGTRIGFSSTVFPANPITLLLGELPVPAASTIFLDASNLNGSVTLSGNNASRHFSIPATATLALHSLTLTAGRAPDGPAGTPGGSGGAILNSGTLSLLHTTLHDNRAGNGGSGDEESAGRGGNGGALANSGTARFVSSTFSGNRAGDGGFSFDDPGNGGDGGGIRNTGSLTLVSSTVSANRAGDSGPPGTSGQEGNGGGISIEGGSLHLAHSVISGNQPGFGPDDDGSGPDIIHLDPPLTTTGANFIGTTTGIFVPFNGPAPLTGNAHLAPLGDYGGPTKTMLPLPGSPLIDAAPLSTRPTDQRGFPTVGTPDLGAAEYQGTTDLRLFWNTDWDGDGNAFGVEFAVGTDPAASDPSHPKNLKFTINSNGHPTFIFGRNPAANPTTTWVLKRSTTLLPDSFTTIFRFEAPFVTFTGTSGLVYLDSFEIIDLDPPPGGKAFYRLEAVSP